MERENKIAVKEIVFLVLLAAFVFGGRLPHVFDPLDRDEGAYAYTAARTMQGELPYKDSHVNAAPMVYYLYRAAFDLFGKDDTAIRSFTTLYVIFTAVLIYMFTRAFAGAAAALLAALFYCVFLNSGSVQGFGSGAEIFTNFTAVLSLFFLLDRDRTYEKANFFIAGFLVAASLLTSAVFVFSLLVPFIYIFAFIKERKSRYTGLIWYGAGFLTPALLAVLWALKHAMLNEFLECVISYNSFYMSQSGKAAGPAGALSGLAVFAKQNIFLAAAFLYAGIAIFRKNGSQAVFVMYMSALSVLAGILFLGGAMPGYYAAIVPFLAICAAFMVKDAVLAALKMKNMKRAAVAAILLAALAGVFQAFYHSGIFSGGKNAEEQEFYAEARAFGLELKHRKAQGASVFVWPNEPEIYFYSGLKAASRFLSTHAFANSEENFRLVYAGLMTSPPEYFVLKKNPAENLFDNTLKTYYSKSLEGERFILYKKGGAR